MNVVIATFSDYDAKSSGTPWAAPCDSTGRPDFKSEKTGHFTGGRGKGGDLFVSDPEEYSVWCYGQKDYAHGNSPKHYARFRAGQFWAIDSADLLKFIAIWEEHKGGAEREKETYRELIARLRATESRSKRALLDEAADAIAQLIG